ncbi:MAG: TonB-dependent receptor plug domain-containing protein [Pseudomonadales bacterium]|nr:TonB-dependent receptor plug domain-containing protein [Pseudomonadales bacterium]
MLNTQRGYLLFTVLLSTVFANTGFAEERVIEEVVVTAHKRAQTVQDTAAAVAAITGDALDDQGIDGPFGLQFVTPSMQVADILGRTYITIRGVGLNQGSPGVAIHVDGVYQPDPRMGELLQLDLERVEVLRGPQGTLYGRNANGGAVNYITKAPEDEFDAYVLAGGNDYDELRTQGMINIPLSDQLSARVIASWRDQDEGYVENILPGGKDFDKSESKSARLRLRYTPSDTFEADFSASFSDLNGPVQYFTLSTEPNPVSVFLNPSLGTATTTQEPWKSSANDRINTDQEYTNVSVNLTWDLDTVTLKSITGYTDYDEVSHADDDGISITMFPSVRSYDQESLSQEFNISYVGDNIDVVGGVYYSEDDFNHTLDYDLLEGVAVTLLPAAGLPIGSDLLFTVPDFDTEVMAVFGDVTYHVNEQLSLMAGVRYTDESQSQTQANSIQIGATGPVIPTCALRTNDADYDATTFRAGASYAFSDNVNGYFTYSEGFKSGGYNAYACDDNFQPEEIEAYEVGLKTELLDSALTLNLSAFFYDYTDLQISQVVGLTRLIDNAPKAEVKGAEVEVAWVPNQHWMITGNVSWLDATYKEFTNTDGLNPGIGDQVLDGNYLNHAPKLSTNLSVSYTTPMTDMGLVVFRADYSYRDNLYFREFNGPLEEQESYAIVNLNVIWESPSEQYSVRLFANNLTDEVYVSQMDASDNFGARFQTWGRPRVYGGEVKVRF